MSSELSNGGSALRLWKNIAQPPYPTAAVSVSMS